ncbi:GGDEF domain-containing protein [Saccharibacillus sp. JS10]|uniref:sensor domain-containing diguanylate cyclase n=1 Tax=Saccharibacillus sp. JS10 TaxID=2950552 RepID=UPI00210A039A|nr:GGDEF domain-containing protein [Saccharibacillus sp. JS10]MCQ4087462.1 GGDEF domain-containing protein [Saccharibacillus sp. JS10]
MNILFYSDSQDQLFHISPRQRRVAAVLSLIMIALTVIGLFFAHWQLPDFFAFFPVIGAWGIFGDILTAFILFNQFRASPILPLLILGSTFLLNGLLSFLYLMTLMDAMPTIGTWMTDTQSGSWLWCFWHASFPIGILLFTASMRSQIRKALMPREQVRKILTLTTLSVIAIAVLLFMLVTFGHDWLPVIIENGDYSKLITSGIGPFLWVLNAVAFVVSIFPYRKTGILRVWLRVSSLAFLLGITLSLSAGERFTVGWYGARIDSLIASIVVVVAIVSEVNKLFVRLSRQREELKESKQALEAANEQLKELAGIDSLTRIANRRKFDETLKQELNAPQREKEPLSLLMIDIDFFKAYNDNYGHLGGDMVLRSVAPKLESEALAHFGFTARYGGEEFAIILPGHSEQEAEQIAELMLESVRSLNIPHQHSGVSNQITISVGGCTLYPGEKTTPHDLIHRADQALYQAKAQGRSRFVFAQSNRPRRSFP